jgi:hypothetical protein
MRTQPPLPGQPRIPHPDRGCRRRGRCPETARTATRRPAAAGTDRGHRPQPHLNQSGALVPLLRSRYQRTGRDDQARYADRRTGGRSRAHAARHEYHVHHGAATNVGRLPGSGGAHRGGQFAAQRGRKQLAKHNRRPAGRRMPERPRQRRRFNTAALIRRYKQALRDSTKQGCYQGLGLFLKRRICERLGGP